MPLKREDLAILFKIISEELWNFGVGAFHDTL